MSRLWFVCSDLHSIVVTNQAPALDLAELILGSVENILNNSFLQEN